MATKFVSYFQDLLGTVACYSILDNSTIRLGSVLTTDQQQQLITPITSEEIRQALLDIGNDKALGPNGYSVEFFKATWDIVNSDLQQALMEFFTSGHLLKKWNHTLLVLVPKSDHAPRVMDYRPISCCTVIFKIISMILATRMAAVIDSILDPAQFTFVRSICNKEYSSSLTTTEEIHQKKSISSMCTQNRSLESI